MKNLLSIIAICISTLAGCTQMMVDSIVPIKFIVTPAPFFKAGGDPIKKVLIDATNAGKLTPLGWDKFNVSLNNKTPSVFSEFDIQARFVGTDKTNSYGSSQPASDEYVLTIRDVKRISGSGPAGNFFEIALRAPQTRQVLWSTEAIAVRSTFEGEELAQVFLQNITAQLKVSGFIPHAVGPKRTVNANTVYANQPGQKSYAAFVDYKRKPFPRSFVIADQDKYIEVYDLQGPSERRLMDSLARCFQAKLTGCRVYSVDDWTL